MKNIIFLTLIGIILFSCNPKPENGFTVAENGLEYKFITYNENEFKPSNDDILVLDLSYSNSSGKILYSSTNENRQYLRKLKPSQHSGGSLEDGLALMHIGDSIILQINAYDFFRYSEGLEQLPKGVNKGEKIIINIKLLDIVEKQDMSNYLIKDNHSSLEKELELLESYISRSDFTDEKLESGMYYKTRSKGLGKHPHNGDIVEVHYTGKFIDGKVFDSSLGKEPFSFTLGKNSVIKGWEEGIKLMQVGEKATLVIPSNLAYGDTKRGKILPFSTLVFDVELLSIN